MVEASLEFIIVSHLHTNSNQQFLFWNQIRHCQTRNRVQCLCDCNWNISRA